MCPKRDGGCKKAGKCLCRCPICMEAVHPPMHSKDCHVRCKR